MNQNQGELFNRYDDPLLSEYYSEIVECLPEYPVLRNVVVDVLQEILQPGETLLDIGAGRGDSAAPLLERVQDVSVDLLDVSDELLGEANEFLKSYEGRFKIIKEDALLYLNRCAPYRTIISEFTVHNFYQEDKKKLFDAICHKLQPGGHFILLDKVRQDDAEEAQSMHEDQIKRYRDGLEPFLADAIIRHENEDAKDDVRMIESATRDLLRGAGFSSVEIVQRIKRDVVIRATK